MSLKDNILIELKKADDFVSGQLLCERYNVTRAAVWKAIKQLEAANYEIEAVTNKGYRLVSSPNLLSESEIKSFLNTKWLGNSIHCFDVIGSTNVQISTEAEAGAKEGLLAVADRQQSGKGRRGRTWQTPDGVAIAMSFLLRPDIDIANVSMITLISALAVAGAMKDLIDSEAEVSIKWPNDIVIGGKKVCGILTEMSMQMDYVNYIVVGIGINVNNTSFAKEIEATATSLYLENGRESVSRAKLIAKICEHFENYYEVFLKTQDMSGLVDSYDKMLVSVNKPVRILDPKGEYTAISSGIDERGRLIVTRDDNGEVEHISSGEVSVRGIYGYI